MVSTNVEAGYAQGTSENSPDSLFIITLEGVQLIPNDWPSVIVALTSAALSPLLSRCDYNC